MKENNHSFTELNDFVRKSIGYQRKIDLELSQRIELKESDKGFYSQWRKEEDRYYYRIYIPKEKKKLTPINRLTLLHEIGHVIFNEMFYNKHTKLERVLAHIHNEHPIFVSLQKFWYWNSFIRKIKMKLGFSFDIQYKPEDLYDKDVNLIITRADNEMFCDYFSLFIKKKYNFFLDR